MSSDIKQKIVDRVMGKKSAPSADELAVRFGNEMLENLRRNVTAQKEQDAFEIDLESNLNAELDTVLGADVRVLHHTPNHDDFMKADWEPTDGAAINEFFSGWQGMPLILHPDQVDPLNRVCELLLANEKEPTSHTSMSLKDLIITHIDERPGLALGGYIKELIEESRKTVPEIKATVLELINEGDLILTADRKLELSASKISHTPLPQDEAKAGAREYLAATEPAVLHLDEQSGIQFVEALLNPPEPSDALKQAAQRYMERMHTVQPTTVQPVFASLPPEQVEMLEAFEYGVSTKLLRRLKEIEHRVEILLVGKVSQ